MESMRFTAEQCAKLKFPVGCPVWYNFPRKEDDDASAEVPSTFFLKRGVVQSAIWRDSKLFYEVSYVTNSSVMLTEEVEDGKLGFGSTCPVTILPLPDTVAADPLEGEILFCTPSTTDPNGFVYTAMMFLDGMPKVRYEEGIEEKRIVYRKVEFDDEGRKKNTGAAVDAVCEGACADDNAGAVQAYQLSSAVQTLSKSSPKTKEYGSLSTMRTNSGSYEEEEEEEGVVIEEQMRSLLPHSITCSDSYASREKATGPSKLEILVPLWLQKDRTCQRSLFFHIIGANGCKIKRIENEARCKVHIVRSGDGEAPFVQMKIYVEAMNTPSALRDLKLARQMIQSLLLEFVGNDGSRGRLLYEVAQSCWGSHRPNQSTSRAVKDFRPFFISGQQEVYMSVVELPFVREEGGQIFHGAHNVLMKGNLDKIQASGCFVYIVQNGFRIPTERCDPYVFVYGKHFRSVDRAVDTVKYIIKGHQKTCSCTY
ncbi:hypothetical protein ACHAXM_002840 [Skeletonema potamos]